MTHNYLTILRTQRFSSINRKTTFIWLALLVIVVISILRVLSFAQPWNFNYIPYQEKYRQALTGNVAAMPDNELYAWAGWRYVHGLSPEKLNFEHPPLAKYLIGFSEVVFGSHVALSVILGIATIFISFFIGRRILPSWYALLPPFFLAFDSLFTQFFATSMLDVYCSFFVSLYVLLFLLFRQARWLWIPLGLVIGLSVASKWVGLFAFPALVLFAAIQKDKRAISSLLMSLPLAVLTYASTYAVYFIGGHSILDFVGLQLEIWKFQSTLRFGRGTPPLFWLLFNFLTGIEGPATWTHIFVNWTARSLNTTSIQYGISIVPFYNPFTWPLSFAASIFAILYGWKRAPLVLPSAFVFLSFLLATSYGQVFIWYLLPGLPFAFLSLAYLIFSVKSTITSSTKANLLVITYCVAVAAWSLFFQLPTFISTG